MDNYYLSKDDWDTIVELGVGANKDEAILKKISTATKTNFTKKFNSSEHPIPFHKAHEFGKVPKKLPGGPAPDIEDAFELEDDVEEEPKVEDEEDDDVSKDKMIKQPKAKGKAAAATKGKGKAKK